MGEESGKVLEERGEQRVEEQVPRVEVEERGEKGDPREARREQRCFPPQPRTLATLNIANAEHC